jgi:tRNA U34 5-methylaminomethyl-2-thiouridine-forming methyltransferase MnmC
VEQKRELQLTADGSYTLFVPDMDEHYHSVNGAVQESNHVFIDTALRKHPSNELSLMEIGFGTGLNAFLTLIEADRSKRKVVYHTVESYPLPSEITSKLEYTKFADAAYERYFRSLHECEWDKVVNISEYFSLHKIKGDANGIEMPNGIDIVYFDAFAPDKQPEMWSQEIFNKLYAAMNEGGILSTYCAKGKVRRMMQRAGFSVERIAGPPGKREMLRANKL